MLLVKYAALKACGIVGALEEGRKVYNEMIKRGVDRELSAGNTLVDVLTKCSSLLEARQVFDWLPIRDSVSWAALVAGYGEHGLDEDVLNCFSRMQLAGLSADAATFCYFLKACASTGALETGREIHLEIRKSGLEKDTFVGNMLIDMYGQCGSVLEGQKVFDKLPVRDVVAWTTMIKTYGENYECSMAVQCFEDMKDQGVRPDCATFTCLLNACSRASLVSKGQQYFKLMGEQHKIEPCVDHYACMVDLFARSGHVNEAERFVAAMKYVPSKEIMLALLSASKLYGKVDLGERCFQQLVELNEEDGAGYSLMAGTYVSAGRWSDANRIEEIRKYTRANKKLGSASIEVDKRLYDFNVGANQSLYMLEMLDLPNLHMRNDGYIPNVDSVLRCSLGEEKEITSHGFVNKYNRLVPLSGCPMT